MMNVDVDWALGELDTVPRGHNPTVTVPARALDQVERYVTAQRLREETLRRACREITGLQGAGGLISVPKVADIMGWEQP